MTKNKILRRVIAASATAVALTVLWVITVYLSGWHVHRSDDLAMLFVVWAITTPVLSGCAAGIVSAYD